MKRALPFLLLLCVTYAQAQLYKSVGPDGKVTYSDVPPPKGQVEKKSVKTGGSGSADLPYELAEAAKNHPVTLYTSSACLPCDDGRALLTKRGIPFSEKTVSTNEDMLKLRQAGGEQQLPVLLVGRDKQLGFQADQWNTALTAAGYPASSKLPVNYKKQPAEAAAPLPESKKAEEKPPAAQAPAPRPRPAAPSPREDTPPGFRF